MTNIKYTILIIHILNYLQTDSNVFYFIMLIGGHLAGSMIIEVPTKDL